MDDKLSVSVKNLDERTSEIANSIIEEKDVDTVKDLTHLFNLNQAKKNVIRIMKLNGLLDTVSDRMIERFEKYPDNFTNADLLAYMQATQGAIDKANKSLALVDESPAIQVVTQNNVNVSIVDGMDSESKDRVLNAIKSILESTSSDDDEDIITIGEDENELSN